MVDPPEKSIDDVQIQVHMSGDGIAEVTTYDHAVSPGSNYLDSEAIETGLDRHQKRGRTRDKNREMSTPTLPTLLRFIKAAGVEKIEVFDPHNRSVRHELPVKNQADILYYSGHGYSSDGSLECYNNRRGRFTVNDVVPIVNWKEDLDYFIIAGCAVLYPDNINGFAWGNETLKKGILKGLAGYHGLAPADNEFSEEKGDYISNSEGLAVRIAKRFVVLMTTKEPNDYGTGHRVLNAWLQANRLVVD